MSKTSRAGNGPSAGTDPGMGAEASRSSRSEVVVIDAGVGNLGNLARALEHLGVKPIVTKNAEQISEASCLVLPGVGAFRPPRENLRGPLEAAIRGALERGAHLLGICVGYQLLFASATEHGDTDGLGLLPGTVERLSGDVRLPQIGWNRLVEERPGHPLFRGIEPGSYFYFVHSFAPLKVPDSAVLARAVHGVEYVAVAEGRGAGGGYVLGTQFHPEKSGPDGLRLIANFLELAISTAGTAEAQADRPADTSSAGVSSSGKSSVGRISEGGSPCN